jgi:hypothetical protein
MSASDSFQLCGLRSDEELDYRQRGVLSALSEEQKATYSFQGLRRKLGLHQEMLSRTLDRLVQQHVVERTQDGYRIALDKRTSRFEHVGTVPTETRALTAHLPHELDPNRILSGLKGRWFGEFRWLGYSATSSSLTMSWMSDDGRVQLRAKLLNNTLIIDAIYGSVTERDQAMRSAFELFDLITDRTVAMSQVAS